MSYNQKQFKTDLLMANFDFSMNPNYQRSPQIDSFRSTVQATVSGIKKCVQHSKMYGVAVEKKIHRSV